MTKRFKLKISRILFYKSCRSNDSSSLPFNPSPSLPRRLPPPSAAVTHYRRLSSFRLFVLTAFGCGSSRRPSSTTPLDVDRKKSPSLSPPFHVVDPPPGEYERRRRKIYDGVLDKDDRRRSWYARRRASSSSDEEYKEEKESLLPSSTTTTKHSPENLPRVTGRRKKEESESSSPAVVVEGVAVVKRSEDPYEDFKGSMMEMIVEKKIVEVDELEQLLRCFLTLNAKRHHRAIVRAFSAVWVTLFSDGGRRSSSFSTVRLSDSEECY